MRPAPQHPTPQNPHRAPPAETEPSVTGSTCRPLGRAASLEWGDHYRSDYGRCEVSRGVIGLAARVKQEFRTSGLLRCHPLRKVASNAPVVDGRAPAEVAPLATRKGGATTLRSLRSCDPRHVITVVCSRPCREAVEARWESVSALTSDPQTYIRRQPGIARDPRHALSET